MLERETNKPGMIGRWQADPSLMADGQQQASSDKAAPATTGSPETSNTKTA
jgi:hypothetical protein